MQNTPHKSSIGKIDANVFVLVLFILTLTLSFIPGVRYVCWLLPLAAYFLEKDSGFIQLYAMQMVALYAVYAIIVIVLDAVRFSLQTARLSGGITMDIMKIAASYAGEVFVGIVGAVTGVVFVIIAIFTMVKAYRYEAYEIPVFGKLAAKLRQIKK
ncbi:MAG: hypothetical protein ACOYJB_02470 [Christensenellaceae bacterium]